MSQVPVLLVIDMQGQPRVTVTAPDGTVCPPDDRTAIALTAWDCTLSAISGLILDAVRRDNVVVFLEDAKVPQPTHPALWYALGAHPAIVVRKFLHDGSASVFAALDSLGISPSLITVCGALTSVCVKQTVLGLRRDLGNDAVTVAPDACFPDPWMELDYAYPDRPVPLTDPMNHGTSHQAHPATHR